MTVTATSDSLSQPLSASEKTLVAIFFAALVPTFFVVVGLLAAAILAVGWVLMRRHRDFSYLQTAVTITTVLAAAGALVFGAFGLFIMVEAQQFAQEFRIAANYHDTVVWLSVSTAILVYAFLLHKLYLVPLKAHRVWVERNGAFAARELTQENREVVAIKSENPKSYSVADELLKWAALKDAGHISEAEFNQARAKLLNRD